MIIMHTDVSLLNFQWLMVEMMSLA